MDRRASIVTRYPSSLGSPSSSSSGQNMKGNESNNSHPTSSANSGSAGSNSSSSSSTNNNGSSSGNTARNKAASSEAEQFIRKAIGSQQTFSDWRALIHSHLERKLARNKDAAAAAAAMIDEEAEAANAASKRQVCMSVFQFFLRCRFFQFRAQIKYFFGHSF